MTREWKENSMPHVDEGTLHAYLDGELPSAERKTLETHLAECASCRASLEEQRALIERASALLGAARPAERAAPPFEQLRPRSPKRSPWRVRIPVAWAASIALALGLGYFLRQPSSQFAVSTLPEAAPLLRAEPNKPDTAPAQLGQRDRLLARAPASKTYVATAESAGLKAEEADRVAQQRIADSLVSLDVERQQQAKLGAAERDRTPRAPVSAPTAAAGGAANAAPAAATPAPAKDSLAVHALIVDGAARRQVAELRGRATTTSWPIISRGTARSLLGTDPVGLPGLARQIRRSPSADGTVVVEQKIDSATTIQIFQRQSGMDSSGNAQYYYRQPEREIARDDRLARYVGRLRIEIAGPLSIDSLNKLLDQVQPLP
jgi:anti-sigma factor RsiW